MMGIANSEENFWEREGAGFWEDEAETEDEGEGEDEGGEVSEEDLAALEDAIDEAEGGIGGGESPWDRADDVEDEGLPPEVGEQEPSESKAEGEPSFACCGSEACRWCHASAVSEVSG